MKKLILLLSIITINTSSYKKEYCDIKGNVKNPGVYEIKSNYTIQDIINDAGGLKKDSYTKNINLSKRVTDEMVIYIFNKKEINSIEDINNCVCKPVYKYIECENTTNSTSTTKIPTIKDEKKTTTKHIETTTKHIETTTKQIETITNKILININTCTKEDLLNIKGLGEVKAKAIIDYRNENGLFNCIEDIMNVKGIGKSTFEKIKEYITV